MTRTIVVVGAGQAGFAVATRLRAQGFDGRIVLIGEEPFPPYQRPPLSKKYLTGEMTRERLGFRPDDFYRDNDIDLQLDSRVTAIDRTRRTVCLTGGRDIPFDTLVLATGARPIHLPDAMGGNLQGVYSVRTLADVDAMQAEFRKGARILIVGGGYVGLEAAAVAAQLGLDTTVVEAAPRILQRVAAAETADFFRDLHKAQGVRLIEGAGLERLTGSARVDGAVLADGRRIDVDFVVAGIGVTPCTELAEDAGLEIDNGIKVNALCQSSDPDIYAVGDCASFPFGNTRLRLESVPNAIDQGNATADAILGSTEPYRARPWFWSDQFHVKLQIAGLNKGHDHTVLRAGDRPGAMSVWYFRRHELIAVDAANDPGAYMTGKRWIERGLSPNPADLCDPEQPLRDIKAV
ncbi:NAD(P)/FAD-dependent oxidoreductase [Chachezhania sediminis]|uniref:NAD(P)/FAD-dependent oxidoreductase n=1 Tax=Chachezhania sediminis TaxID=2599291 RepID=UPI00131E4884|nr:FAD-dependent oxidoreductase [Chachezhania sediminis]